MAEQAPQSPRNVALDNLRVVAMLLGAWLANEHVGRTEAVALLIIINGVLLVLPFKRNEDPKSPSAGP